ncbi:MAG: hypothetical protein DMF84_08400 [Acidobacteria bacterium]|nr:MAG: hypothetical protein DMF84_08400 [Acidobacteriota bacterium]
MAPVPDAANAWVALALLGAFHGINPGMGWLFAVALGMQENRAAAVWRALLPLGVGHACAIALAITLAFAAGAVIPASTLKWPIAAFLVFLGIRRLLRHRHPRWGGMRIGPAGLTVWSFLVATAHGAGLMVLPIWLHMPAQADVHGSHMYVEADVSSGLSVTLVHGASYLLVTTVIAWIVFAKVGVGLLRRSWINLDVIWAGALIVTGGVTLLLR